MSTTRVAYYKSYVPSIDYNLPFTDFLAKQPSIGALMQWNLCRVREFIASGDASAAGIYARELAYWSTIAD